MNHIASFDKDDAPLQIGHSTNICLYHSQTDDKFLATYNASFSRLLTVFSETPNNTLKTLRGIWEKNLTAAVINSGCWNEGSLWELV